MKIHIENKSKSMLNSVCAVREYITKYGYKETAPNTGTKVFYLKGASHVSCRKTKAGNYTFVVWLGV